jgi:hypothetical protein
MRFTADYDSEEEEFPVNDASRESTPLSVKEIDHFDLSSEEEEYEGAAYNDGTTHFSPKNNRDAWVFSSASVGRN